MSALPLVPAPVRVRADADAAPLRLTGGDTPGTDAVFARLLAIRTRGAVTSAPVSFTETGSGSPESYRIVVDATSATVTAPDAAGLFYGAQTLAQLVHEDDGNWSIPAVEIDDAPRFAYRGAMLDVARHFFSVDTVTDYIDRIAALKLNHLHLHLTDDQGWRIALSSRPELAAKASGSAALGDAGGSYSAEDYAAIVAYAAARFVTIVPEVDVPGHTHAIGLAYPEIAADPVLADSVLQTVADFGGGVPERGVAYPGFAVGFSSLVTDDDRTYDFLADVFGELAAMTPGPYLHLGGDEALGTSRTEYETFVRRAVGIVAATGKQPIAWHEAGRVSDLPAPLIAQYWGYVDPVDDAADAARAVVAASGSIILSPADAIYLDMKPEADFDLGLTWANGPTSLADAYGWEPSEVVEGLDEAAILGVEAPLWTETVRTAADIDALAFPRIAAAAEIAWSPRGAHERATFTTRVAGLAPLWNAAGIGFHRSPEIVWSTA